MLSVFTCWIMENKFKGPGYVVSYFTFFCSWNQRILFFLLIFGGTPLFIIVVFIALHFHTSFQRTDVRKIVPHVRALTSTDSESHATTIPVCLQLKPWLTAFFKVWKSELCFIRLLLLMLLVVLSLVIAVSTHTHMHFLMNKSQVWWGRYWKASGFCCLQQTFPSSSVHHCK